MAGKRSGRSHVMSLTQRVEQLEAIVLAVQQAVFMPWGFGSTTWNYPLEHPDEPSSKKIKTDANDAPGTPPRLDPVSPSMSNNTPVKEVRLQPDQPQEHHGLDYHEIAAQIGMDDRDSASCADLARGTKTQSEWWTKGEDHISKYEEKLQECETLRARLQVAEELIRAKVPVDGSFVTSDALQKTVSAKTSMLESTPLDFASIVRKVVGHQIYCKHCYKTASNCLCDSPFFSFQVCRECGGNTCDCNAGYEDEIHSAGTAEECVLCKRLDIDDQCDMGCCSGQGCGAKAHCGCAGFDSVTSQECAAWKCQACVRDNVPLIESDSDSEPDADRNAVTTEAVVQQQRVEDLERCRMKLEDVTAKMSTCFSKRQVEEEIQKGTLATVNILTPQITAQVQAQVAKNYEGRLRELEQELRKATEALAKSTIDRRVRSKK